MRARGLLIVLLPATLVVLALDVRSLAEGAFAALTNYETPFAFPTPEEPRAKALSERVAMVLIDGLGVGPSRNMAFLNELRARGADYDVRIGLPSLSQPGRAVMMTGAWQEVHGQATNMNPRPIKVEHLFQTARRAGLSTGLSGMGKGVQKLFQPYVVQKLEFEEPDEESDFDGFAARFREMTGGAEQLFGRMKPRFGIAELLLVDEAGHNWGGASPEYKRAYGMADDALRRIVASVDLSTTTLVITADHGHVDVGGHGGPEPPVMNVPLVLLGKAIRSGVTGECRQTDIASTLATLLGVDIPAANQGRPLLDALETDAGERVPTLRRVYAQRREFVRRYVSWVAGTDAEQMMKQMPGAAPGDEPGLLAALDALDRLASDARDHRLALESLVRSRLSLALALLPLVAVVVLLGVGVVSARELRSALLWGLLGQALYYASMPVFGIAYSMSAINKDGWMEPFFKKDMLLGLVTCAIVCAASAAFRARRGIFDPASVVRFSWLVAWAFTYVSVLKVALIYWRNGVVLSWHLPDLYWGFGFYLDALVIVAVGLVSPLMPLLGWIAARAFRGGAPAGDVRTEAA